MKYNFNELKEIVKSKMSLKRFTHTLGVVEMSEKLEYIMLILKNVKWLHYFTIYVKKWIWNI